MTNEFQLFPDIRLVYSDRPVIAGSAELMICCCVSGVSEFLIGERYFYLTADTILALGNISEYMVSCSNDFCGVYLIITPGSDNADISDMFGLSTFLQDIQQNGTLVYQADGRIKDLLSAMITGVANSMTSLMRLKTIELFMLLGDNIPDRHNNQKALQVGEFICREISERFTIPKLSEIFRVNQTALKNTFRCAYGCGIYSYIKKRKMFRAAELIVQTDMKMIDVAEEVGYSNASKFAGAFRSVIGISPKHFRMEHKPDIPSGNRL